MIKLWNTEIIIKVIKQEKIIGDRGIAKIVKENYSWNDEISSSF